MKENNIDQEGFDTLLEWLDQNRESAGQKYEKIRQRLIRIFAGRGCFEAEELADETINRVTRKLPQIAENYTGEPALYFFGVADNIHHEWLRKQKKIKNVEFTEIMTRQETVSGSEFECLENCLETLPENQKTLIIEYYRQEKTAKILHHKELAKNLGISLNALQVQTCRIRARLQKCVRECVAEKNI